MNNFHRYFSKVILSAIYLNVEQFRLIFKTVQIRHIKINNVNDCALAFKHNETA